MILIQKQNSRKMKIIIQIVKIIYRQFINFFALSHFILNHFMKKALKQNGINAKLLKFKTNVEQISNSII